MISEDEYYQLLPHKEDIIKFQTNKSLRNPNILTIANKIFQRHGMGSINFGCDSCKIQAMTDIWNMMVEYEQANK